MTADTPGNINWKTAASCNALNVADYFTVHNTVSESSADSDWGSCGAPVLPDL